MPKLPPFVEVGPERRLYEVVVVKGYPTKNGNPYHAIRDHARQRIEVSDRIPVPSQIAAVEQAASGVISSRVKVYGRVA